MHGGHQSEPVNSRSTILFSAFACTMDAFRSMGWVSVSGKEAFCCSRMISRWQPERSASVRNKIPEIRFVIPTLCHSHFVLLGPNNFAGNDGVGRLAHEC